MGTAMSSSARQGGYRAKLRALVREHFGVDGASVDAGSVDVEPGGFPGGATLRLGPRGWVLAGGEAARSLGGALAWARQFEVSDLHVLVDDADAAGAMARQAQAFVAPPMVWRVDGRALVPAPAAELAPERSLPSAAEPFRALFADAGADPVAEDGLLLAEVLGLEVARVGADGVLEVGVGKHDREAQKLMHPDVQPFDALVAAVEAVRELRTPDAPTHPMNQLAAARWLRAVVCKRPELVGASGLRPVSSTLPLTDLRLPSPAAATGNDATGDGVTVVCSTGVDLALVPVAADVRLRHPGRLVLVVPEIDAHPVTHSLAAALREPATVVTVPADWRRL
ncbi:MAG: hypothetical protein QOI20_910 [Acidimicrobiaceae bacterium]|nr:hypothetical protein [Acidimicrobiaceae bacterium]